MGCETNQPYLATVVDHPKLAVKYRTDRMCLSRAVYLIHDVGDGLYQVAVFLSQEAVPPLLLPQSRFMALLEEVQILATILKRHVFIECVDTLIYMWLTPGEPKPGCFLSTAASPSPLPGCGPPSHSASCCPVPHRNTIMSSLCYPNDILTFNETLLLLYDSYIRFMLSAMMPCSY